jgi:glycerol-3-phosphate dehydrogenase
MYDVVIIGSGIIGAMIARELSKYELNICILEKENDVACGSTKANSAIVHAGFDAKEGTLKAKLNVLGSQLMEQICKDLGVKYINNGSLVLGFNDDDFTTIKTLYERGINNGVEGLQILDYETLHKLEPNVSKNALYALYAPTGAITCPYELTIACVGNAMDNGTILKCNFDVKTISKVEDYYVINSESECVKTKFVINAAGIYSDTVAKMIGDNSFTISPRRGEYILLDKDCGNTVGCTIFKTPSKMGKGILVSPTVDGNLLLGPTSVDIVDKDNKNTTDEGFAQILKLSNEYVENINTRAVITSFCGLRSVGSTGDFIINSPNDGFINVAGIESPGLSASPAIALYVKDLLQSQLNLIPKDHYISTRKSMTYFKDASIEEKNAIIKNDPTFGRIICRCETVTEGEILEALRTNPKPTDLDGIKRRTRAQMGRCQGGFCIPYIVKLISQENGLSMEQVTKNGYKSELIVSKTKEGC